MLNAEIMRDAEKRRLSWRCRRGMLELDIVLQRFINEQFSALTLAELEVFDELLELPDNQFWTLLQTDKPQANVALASLLKKLNATNDIDAQECV
jgi:antitoxin CptB